MKCNKGFYFSENKKCQKCETKMVGCTDCTQDGKTCNKCDEKQFFPQPISNECQCLMGTYWDKNAKQCQSCKSKILNCEGCAAVQDNEVWCF